MYMDPAYATPVLTSTQLAATVAGREVCNNGAFTGPRCSATINGDRINYCDVREDGRNVCHLVDTYRSEGVSAGAGDSGGPVYFPTSPNRQFVGIISGAPMRASYFEQCDRYPWLDAANTTSRECTRAGTYTLMSWILDAWNAQVTS
jgi:hypothetical protein